MGGSSDAALHKIVTTGDHVMGGNSKSVGGNINSLKVSVVL